MGSADKALQQGIDELKRELENVAMNYETGDRFANSSGMFFDVTAVNQQWKRVTVRWKDGNRQSCPAEYLDAIIENHGMYKLDIPDMTGYGEPRD